MPKSHQNQRTLGNKERHRVRAIWGPNVPSLRDPMRKREPIGEELGICNPTTLRKIRDLDGINPNINEPLFLLRSAKTAHDGVESVWLNVNEGQVDIRQGHAVELLVPIGRYSTVGTKSVTLHLERRGKHSKVPITGCDQEKHHSQAKGVAFDVLNNRSQLCIEFLPANKQGHVGYHIKGDTQRLKLYFNCVSTCDSAANNLPTTGRHWNLVIHTNRHFTGTIVHIPLQVFARRQTIASRVNAPILTDTFSTIEELASAGRIDKGEGAPPPGDNITQTSMGDCPEEPAKEDIVTTTSPTQVGVGRAQNSTTAGPTRCSTPQLPNDPLLTTLLDISGELNGTIGDTTVSTLDPVHPWTYFHTPQVQYSANADENHLILYRHYFSNLTREVRAHKIYELRKVCQI